MSLLFVVILSSESQRSRHGVTAFLRSHLSAPGSPATTRPTSALIAGSRLPGSGVAIAAIESFNKAILHRFARFDELERYAMRPFLTR